MCRHRLSGREMCRRSDSLAGMQKEREISSQTIRIIFKQATR
jgi:hypothetical protein